ncbi:MAG: O-antigen ligase family protein [Patescibacteria group bacterium]
MSLFCKPENLEKPVSYLLLALVFLLPWQTVWIFQERVLNGAKWQYGTGLIFATEILLWLIIFLWAGLNVKLKIQSLKQKALNFKFLTLSSAVVLSLLFFVIWNLLSIFWSSDTAAAFYSWFHLVEAVLLFFIILTSGVKKQKICWALAAGGALQAVLAIWQFLTQTIVANKWLGISQHLARELGAMVVETADGRWLRAYGAFAHPNILGGFLLLAIFATLFLYFNSAKSQARLLALLFLILDLAGLFFSFSRSAWLGLLFGFLIFLLIYFFRVKTARANLAKLTVYLAALSLILVLIYWPLASARLEAQGRLEQKSIAERTVSLSQAKKFIAGHWLLGVGGGNYTYQLYQNNPKLPAYDFQPVHNIYLLIFSETGIFGLTAFLIFVVTAVMLAWRQKNYFFLPAFLALLLVGLFDHYLITQLAGLAAFFLAGALSLSNQKLNE